MQGSQEISDREGSDPSSNFQKKDKGEFIHPFYCFMHPLTHYASIIILYIFVLCVYLVSSTPEGETTEEETDIAGGMLKGCVI